MDNYSLTAVGSVAFAVVGILVVVWLFARGRKQQGIPPLELTDGDKAQIQELRRGLNPWRLLTGFLGGMGGLAVLAGMASVVGLDSPGKPDWRGGIDCLVFGGILILLAAFLSRRFK